MTAQALGPPCEKRGLFVISLRLYDRVREHGMGAAARRPGTGPPLCKGGTAWQSHAGGIAPDTGQKASHPGGFFGFGLSSVAGCGSTAWLSGHRTGSTAWVRRLAVNPSVGVRRQLPLHKGGPVAGRAQCLGSHISLGRFASNWPFLWHAARIAPQPLPVLARQRRSTWAWQRIQPGRVLAAGTPRRKGMRTI